MSLIVSSVNGAEAKPNACCQKRVKAAASAEPETPKPVQRPFTSLAVRLSAYKPIAIVAGAALAGALMLSAGHGGGAMHVMQAFMGLFLLPLALLKLFDVRGFAAAFARYDVIAKAWPAYGSLYPFAELALALLFLSGLFPTATNMAALLIGAIGTIGIAQTLSRGETVRCACVGSALSVPLGSVSIAENAGMAAMAAAMLTL